MATAGSYPVGYTWWADTDTATAITTNSSHIAGSAGEVMSKMLHTAVLDGGLFMKMRGPEGSFMPVIYKNELKTQPGDIIHMYFNTDIEEQPQDQGLAMWHNESDIRMYQMSVGIGVIKKAMLIDKPVSTQRSIHDLIPTCYSTLERWLTQYGPELMLIKRLCGEVYQDTAAIDIGLQAADTSLDPGIGPDTNLNPATYRNHHEVVMYGGDASSEATIDASDVLTPEMIWHGVEAMRVGILGSTTVRKFHPIPVNGGAYIGVFHPYSIGDLKYAAGSAWVDYQKFANLRGNDNPLFTGTGNLAGQAPTPIGELYGMLIYDYARMPLHTDWGENSSVNGATGVMLGGEAIAYAEAWGPNWNTESGRYDEELGFAVKMLAGAERVDFNSIHSGVFVVKTAAKIHS